MKKSLIILLVLVFTFVSCLCINDIFTDKKTVNYDAKAGRKCIVIDAGHGGVDAGTSALNGTAEKDINLAIALNLYDFLSICGVDCKLIRDSDKEFYPNGEDRSRSDLYNRLDYVTALITQFLYQYIKTFSAIQVNGECRCGTREMLIPAKSLQTIY